MSRIDRDTTKELNALNAHIRARDDYEQIETTDDVYEDTHQYRGNRCVPNMEKTTLTYRSGATPQSHHIAHTGTTPSKYRNTPPLHDKHRNDATKCTTRTDNCWPPIGECQSCGFHPQQRAGDMCIALVKMCSSCIITGHMERACDKVPELNATKPDTHIDIDNPTNGVTETNTSDNQYGHGDSGGEVHLPQDTTSSEQSTSEGQYDARPAEPENHKLHHKHHDHTTGQDVIRATTKDAPGTATPKVEGSMPRTLRGPNAENGPAETFETQNAAGPSSSALRNLSLNLTTMRISEKNGRATSKNVNYSRRNPIPKPEIENQRNPDHDNTKTYPWAQPPRTINALKATTTHELSATG
jgi:hypothetical protein